QLIYTSGTTGNPKGVRLTHLNLASNVSAVREVVPFAPDDRTLAFLPWAHVMGGSIEIGCVVSLGASLAICDRTDKLVDYMSEVRPSIMFAVPRIWNRIYDNVQKTVSDKPAIIQAIFRRGLAAQTRLKRGQDVGLIDKLSLAIAKRLIFSKVVAR